MLNIILNFQMSQFPNFYMLIAKTEYCNSIDFFYQICQYVGILIKDLYTVLNIFYILSFKKSFDVENDAQLKNITTFLICVLHQQFKKEK